nr:MAG TPA: hypothetical protein [Caudoviricetes sp.]
MIRLRQLLYLLDILRVNLLQMNPHLRLHQHRLPPPLSDDVTYVDEDTDEQFELGDHVKITAREYPSATYTWHLPDGSTHEGRELNFIAAPDKGGMYVAYTFQPGSNKVIRTNYNVSFFSIQETAVSAVDKEIHVGDSIEFTAPAAIGMLYNSDGAYQVEDENLEYSWQITSTPDVEDSWTAIAGATEHNFKYVASEVGVYYIRRKATMGDGIAYGGKTKVTVVATQSTPTPTPSATPTPKTLRRISSVRVDGGNVVNLTAGTPKSVKYTVTYNGSLEDTSTDANTDNIEIASKDGIDVTVDKTNKQITFTTQNTLGTKSDVEFEVTSNGHRVGEVNVNVTAVESTSTPTTPVLEEHGVRVNPNDNSASTSTPTPTPKPVDDDINKSTPRPVTGGSAPSPRPVDDGSTPTPTTGPVL